MAVPKIPRVMLVGVSRQVRPVEGEMVETRVTVPESPLRLTAMIVSAPESPALTATPFVLATMMKSSIVNVTVVVRDRNPLVPVTVTV